MRRASAEGHSNAYGCKVCRVGEENGPRVANPLVKPDRTGCGLGFEIGGDRTEAERWHFGRVDDEEDESQWDPKLSTRFAAIK